jgi:hypothetical protein
MTIAKKKKGGYESEIKLVFCLAEFAYGTSHLSLLQVNEEVPSV